jgi:anti-anti-sigma regulatory factor
MAVNVRIDGNVVVLSNFGPLLNNPRHFDAGRDVGALLDQGYRSFALELRNASDVGTTLVAVLLTITRLIRRRGGEAVLAAPRRGVSRLINELQMEDYWDVYDDVEAAKVALERGRRPGTRGDEASDTEGTR